MAVKVQYPGIDEAVKADLANLDVVRLATSLLFKSSDAEAIADEIRVRVTEELDYEIEAANQRLFASWYREHPFIAVPEVVDDLSSRRLLTTDLADGVRRHPRIEPGERRLKLVAEHHAGLAAALLLSDLWRDRRPADAGRMRDHWELNGARLADLQLRHGFPPLRLTCSAEAVFRLTYSVL